MTTIIELSGFEFPNPTATTLPAITRIIGPVDKEGAVAWLVRRGFKRSYVNVYHHGKGMFHRKFEDGGVMVDSPLAFIVGEIKVLVPMTDVEICDDQ